MVRTLLSVCACTALVACGDGRGTQYSSARATPVTPVTPAYIPVTPGATPVITPPAVLPPATASPSAPEISAIPVTRTSRSTPSAVAAPAEPSAGVARGPIYDACQASGRKAATRAQCGCIQWVADRELTAAQQRRGAGFFKDPHGLQEVRQSSERVRANGVFWEAWKAYGARATRQCGNT